MRKNLTRILLLAAATALFNLGTATAFADEGTIVGTFNPPEVPVCVLIGGCNPTIVATGPTDVLEITEIAITPADLVGAAQVAQEPTLAVDIADQGLGVASPSFDPGDIAVFDPAPAGEGDENDHTEPPQAGPAANQTDQQDGAGAEAAPETEAAEEAETAPTAEASEAPASQGGLLNPNAGSDPKGVLLALAVAGIFVTIVLMAVAVGGKDELS